MEVSNCLIEVRPRTYVLSYWWLPGSTRVELWRRWGFSWVGCCRWSCLFFGIRHSLKVERERGHWIKVVLVFIFVAFLEVLPCQFQKWGLSTPLLGHVGTIVWCEGWGCGCQKHSTPLASSAFAPSLSLSLNARLQSLPSALSGTGSGSFSWNWRVRAISFCGWRADFFSCFQDCYPTGLPPPFPLQSKLSSEPSRFPLPAAR